jgi:hypothetical protein
MAKWWEDPCDEEEEDEAERTVRFRLAVSTQNHIVEGEEEGKRISGGNGDGRMLLMVAEEEEEEAGEEELLARVIMGQQRMKAFFEG